MIQLWCVCVFSSVWVLAAPWTVACQAPLSVEFSRLEYWSGLLFPTPETLRGPWLKPHISCIAGRCFTAEPLGKRSSDRQLINVMKTQTHTPQLSGSSVHFFLLKYNYTMKVFLMRWDIFKRIWSSNNVNFFLAQWRLSVSHREHTECPVLMENNVSKMIFLAEHQGFCYTVYWSALLNLFQKSGKEMGWEIKDEKEGHWSGSLDSTLPNALWAVFITKSFDTL